MSVTFDNVSKRFARGYRIRTLAEAVLGWPKRALKKRVDGLKEYEFWALRDVSFEVKPGETLGIIGQNGSGKSTVLKLIFRILRPDGGNVRVQGRVGGLIELGAGFHPYLTGRENVFINGSILGMSRREIRERYGSIVDFAGIAEFMDTPVKNFSSGMYARLAFAIAAHADMDVLLVDEVLAVGDASFQMKCYDWLARQQRQGRAIVTVSHNMYQMAAATRCLWLDGGKVAKVGEPRAVIDAYLESQKNRQEQWTLTDGQGGTKARITHVEFLTLDGRVLTELEYDATVVIRFHYDLREPLQSPIFALTLFADDARYPLQTPNHHLFHVYSGDAFKDQTLQGTGSVDVEVSHLRLPVGQHRVKAYIMEQHGANPVYVNDGIARIEFVRPDWSDGRALLDHTQKWRMPIPAETR